MKTLTTDAARARLREINAMLAPSPEVAAMLAEKQALEKQLAAEYDEKRREAEREKVHKEIFGNVRTVNPMAETGLHEGPTVVRQPPKVEVEHDVYGGQVYRNTQAAHAHLIAERARRREAARQRGASEAEIEAITL